MEDMLKSPHVTKEEGTHVNGLFNDITFDDLYKDLTVMSYITCLGQHSRYTNVCKQALKEMICFHGLECNLETYITYS